jgi:hypothetical protein
MAVNSLLLIMLEGRIERILSHIAAENGAKFQELWVLSLFNFKNIDEVSLLTELLD